MNVIVIEHVKVEELPQAWRARLAQPATRRVTVRIETEEVPPAERTAEPVATDDPAFGIWRDREGIADVPAYVQQLRAGRYNRDGSRNDR